MTSRSGSGQCADTVVMVRPETFYADPQTVATNSFQHVTGLATAELLRRAQAEFDAAVGMLRDADVRVVEAMAPPDTPDALYPNNWFSTHRDGSLVLYPMATENRRRERQPRILEEIALARHWRITRTIDLTGLERDGLYVEGTGSLVLDRDARVAYAAISPRTHAAAVQKACASLELVPLTFDASDPAGRPIYHTNVLMAVGETLAILAAEVIAREHLGRVREQLAATGKELLEISYQQVLEFAGNALFLKACDGTSLVAISARGWSSLDPLQRRILERHARPVMPDVATIEHVGGGGIRCMLAEIFLPSAS